MHPSLEIDIAYSDVWAALLRPKAGLSPGDLARHAPAGFAPVAALSVRSAFDAMLTALDLPPASRIGMTAINIESMAEIVRAHGLEIEPVDIEPETLLPTVESVEAALDRGAKLFVLSHLYGTRSDTDRFAALCASRGAVFVEDCAQAFDGVLRGSKADVLLYSFGPIKAATAFGGGVALFKDRALASRVEGILGRHPALSDAWFRRRLAKFLAVKLLTDPRIYSLTYGVLRFLGKSPEGVLRALTRGFSGARLIERIRKRPPRRLLWLLDRRLERAGPRTAHAARARRIAAAVADSVSIPAGSTQHHAWWLTPVMVAAPDALVHALREQGFDATRGASALTAIAGSADAPVNARRLLAEVVYLPNNSRLSDTDIATMCACVRAVAGRERGQGRQETQSPRLPGAPELRRPLHRNAP